MAKEDIKSKAEKLGIKKENLELGLKKSPEKMETMINKAYKFKFPKEK